MTLAPVELLWDAVFPQACLAGARRLRFDGADLFDGRLTKQRLYQRAIEARSIATFGNHILQHVLHAPQIGDLRAHVLEVDRGEATRLGARLIAFVDQT